MIQYKVYELGPHAFLVLARSLHLLFRPSFYVLLLTLVAATGRWHLFKTLPKYVLWIAVPMLPYIFLTYSPYIPSRQVYLASMVLTAVMAFLIRQTHPRIQQAMVIAFIAYNAGYTWLRNDPQFESRAAPTTQLLSLLRSHEPAPILLEGFPYAVPEVAKGVSRFAPGWRGDLIHVNEEPESCPACLILQWNAESRKYAGGW